MTEKPGLRAFEGAVAFLTGGASGIGRALGEALARRGAHAVLADRQVELAGEAAAGIRARGGEATAVELDVRDFAGFERLVRETAGRHGRLDYLFNNAGIGVGGEAILHRIEDWNRLLDVNLKGVVHGVQAAYALMVEQGFGHVVNTSSMAGLLPMPGMVSYCAAKHAVVGLSASLRLEAAPYGVRVSALCPGVVRTSILDGGGRYGKMLRPVPKELQEEMWARLRPMDADLFAARVLAAVARNQAVIVVPGRWKLHWWLHRLSPALASRLWGRLYAAGKRKLDAASGSGA